VTPVRAAVAAFATAAEKVHRIKGLLRACAGYPQACQQKMWTTQAAGAVPRA
jgi:hypothetical protein